MDHGFEFKLHWAWSHRKLAAWPDRWTGANPAYDIEGKAGQILIANPILFRMNLDPKAAENTAKLVSSFQRDKALVLANACAQNHTWQCPTLIRNETMRFGDEPRYTQSFDLRYIPAAVRQLWSDVGRQYAEKLTPAAKDTMLRLRDLSFRLVKTFDENGVEMLAGSDYGCGWAIPGISLHQEFDLLAAAGLSPLRVLQMTTINGARFLKRENTMGTVTGGKDTNLLVLDANPIDSVQNCTAFTPVIRDGRYYSSEVLTQLKENVAKQVATD